MKITILGAGAMGMLFGGYLSVRNDVWLLDVKQQRIDKINRDGVRIRERETDRVFYPKGVTSCQGLEPMDLVLVFVKAMFTQEALEKNRALLGPQTYLMTLQNGVGHEETLLRYTDKAHVILGMTQHNSSVLDNGYVDHGGAGRTVIGLPEGDSDVLKPIAEMLSVSGFPCEVSNKVKKDIWEKLFLNTAASSLTGILQMPLGYIAENPSARWLMERLAEEAVRTANAEIGAQFRTEDVVRSIRTVLTNAKEGYTSVYADIKNGHRTEVDTISGSVVRAARRQQIAVPYHEAVVAILHALEDRKK